ncbi:hypothetical protein GGR26_002681 [Lewinella marina]|uniref:T9SS type A sorting domain-containing protein n=1 Tax=Neolewinella marina TaxID=438751 RepID=A0A2G0CD42_9BACT|nr:hypothetical protein [Neolewinella marina]NJB86904.1 hypothetical protein [Neolewinella marina]PHK97898.1 hypothetical protein CGL56_13880 [Neolewinella marina]
MLYCVLLLFGWGYSGLINGQTSSYAVENSRVSGYEVGGYSIAPLSETIENSSICTAAAAEAPPPFPLRITDLEATRDNATTVTLSWEIEESDSEYRWTLERRLDVEAVFTTVRELPRALILQREYLDPNAHSGTSYYRVRGEAADGANIYSRIRAVDNEFQRPELRVFPTPTRRAASVQLPDADHPFALRLSDHFGRTVWARRFPAASANPLRLTFPDLPPGVYLLHWSSGAAPGTVARVVVGY